jgi:hypothetical protein
VPAQLADVLRLVFRKDVAGLAGRLSLERRACGTSAGEPACASGEEAGTEVDAFPSVSCDGGFVRGDAVEGMLTSLLTPAGVTYDVLQSVFPAPSGGPNAYRAVFQYVGEDASGGYVVDVAGERVTAVRPTCATIEDETAGVAEYVIPPYTERSSDPSLAYPALPYVAGPYLRFVAVGRFAGVSDEIGDTDPFLLDFGEQSDGDAAGIRELVYWNQGAVYDCGVADCGSPLSASAAQAAIAALKTGDEICIVGTAGDTGHMTGERVYLHRQFVCTAQAVKVGVPPTVEDTTPPVVSGPFRIVPQGYVDPDRVPVTPDPRLALITPVEGGAGAAVTLEQLRGMAGFSEPGYLPSGYAFVRATAVMAGKDLYSYEVTYEGPRGLSIVVGRLIDAGLPYEIERPLPQPSGTSVLEIGTVDERPAALYRLAPGEAIGEARIIVVDGTDVTLVVGQVDGEASAGAMKFDELLRVAESIP